MSLSRSTAWTRARCAPLEACGIFEQKRLELIEGELIRKPGKTRAYVNAFTGMHLWLLDNFGKLSVNANALWMSARMTTPSTSQSPI
jgi:hypothetical protein